MNKEIEVKEKIMNKIEQAGVDTLKRGLAAFNREFLKCPNCKRESMIRLPSGKWECVYCSKKRTKGQPQKFSQQETLNKIVDIVYWNTPISLSKLSRKAKLDRRTVQKSLDILIPQGEIIIGKDRWTNKSGKQCSRNAVMYL